MTPSSAIVRPLGTMIAYGFPRGDVSVDLAIAGRLGATHLEALPDWKSFPNPESLRDRLVDSPFTLHSAHGCWGGQSIAASRVDLGSTDESCWRASLDDLRRCLDWLADAGGTYLVVHPGGLSDPESAASRRDALIRGLISLANHASGSGRVVCVENMPPGVNPGSRMADLASLVSEVDRPEVRLCLDTGHANIVSSAADETRAAGPLLATVHVHDNNGRGDTHEPPGGGTIDWDAWAAALDVVGYRGPIMLECIRILREQPQRIDADFLALLARLTNRRES